MNIPKKTLEDLLAAHLYSVSVANDDEDVELSFNPQNLKNGVETIPIAIKLIRKKEVEVYKLGKNG